MISQPVNNYLSYHAHVYFDKSTLQQAIILCDNALHILKIPVGRIHNKLVGPHPHWSCQLSFTSNQFNKVITWLKHNRQDLTILVHGVTGDNMADHTTHAAWLGEPSILNLNIFIDNNV
ncbi:MAG: aromatic ring-cleaving dioxygenase [Gammaproteobacteria bacterium]|jgi:aromatic ring-cleaving dioxygenase